MGNAVFKLPAMFVQQVKEKDQDPIVTLPKKKPQQEPQNVVAPKPMKVSPMEVKRIPENPPPEQQTFTKRPQYFVEWVPPKKVSTRRGILTNELKPKKKRKKLEEEEVEYTSALGVHKPLYSSYTPSPYVPVEPYQPPPIQSVEQSQDPVKFKVSNKPIYQDDLVKFQNVKNWAPTEEQRRKEERQMKLAHHRELDRLKDPRNSYNNPYMQSSMDRQFEGMSADVQRQIRRSEKEEQMRQRNSELPFQSGSEQEDKHGLPFWLQDINIRTELKLSNMTIDESKLELFNLYLQDNTSLQTLYFEFTKLGNKGVASLCKALEVNKHVKKVTIVNNEIGDQGLIHVSEMLKCNSTITDLDLSHNRIGSTGCETLCEALKINSGLVSLNLSQNNLQDAGLREIAKGISQNSSIKRLVLHDNNIKLTNSFCIALGKNETIEHVNISRNDIDDEGIAHFSDAFKSNSTLKELILSSNPFTTKGVIALQDGLSENKSLKTLHLNDYVYQYPVCVAVKSPQKDDVRVASVVDGWGILKGQVEITSSLTDKINTIAQEMKM